MCVCVCVCVCVCARARERACVNSKWILFNVFILIKTSTFLRGWYCIRILNRNYGINTKLQRLNTAKLLYFAN